MRQPFPATSLGNALALYGAMTAVAAALALVFAPGLRLFALPTSPLAWPSGIGAGLGLVAASRAAERWLPAFRRLGDRMAAQIGPVSRSRALALAVLSGVGEEALFRGPLQVLLGPLLATLLFASLHGLGQRRLWPWPVFAAVAGGVFAALTAQFQSIWPAVAAHVVVNALNLRRLGARWGDERAPGSHV